MNLNLPGALRNLIVEPLSADLEIDLALSFLDRVSELFCFTEDRAKNPELASCSRVERGFTLPARQWVDLPALSFLLEPASDNRVRAAEHFGNLNLVADSQAPQ
jgi:hypothetical protein